MLPVTTYKSCNRPLRLIVIDGVTRQRSLCHNLSDLGLFAFDGIEPVQSGTHHEASTLFSTCLDIARTDSPAMPQLATAELASQVLKESPVLFDKVVAVINCDRDDVPFAVEEVVRFLSLIADHNDGQLTPSHRVDLVWHEFILCTRAYIQFCNQHFNRMIHHTPGGSQEDNQKQFEKTLRLYEQAFGPPNELYWGTRQNPPECGACESF